MLVKLITYKNSSPTKTIKSKNKNLDSKSIDNVNQIKFSVLMTF